MRPPTARDLETLFPAANEYDTLPLAARAFARTLLVGGDSDIAFVALGKLSESLFYAKLAQIVAANSAESGPGDTMEPGAGPETP